MFKKYNTENVNNLYDVWSEVIIQENLSENLLLTESGDNVILSCFL